ncbi:MAG: thioredoxin domain-containing protein [Thermoplasmata archaeon]
MAPPEGSGPVREGGWRLASSTSSYLRSAADSAIDWHPWGPEPFELATRLRRPVLLDIGASWCHWCHVMDEGTYSDPEVARLLRGGFVAVKVDRDEHPEVDRRYQRQVGALTGEGGWPLTAFLTTEGSVFLGGTYFPPTDGHGRPGFRRLLKEVARLWEEEPKELAQHARSIQDALQRHAARRLGDAPVEEFVRSARRRIHESADPVNGGFGGAPKFPHPTAIGFLLWDEFANGVSESGALARATLEHMAAGGMYDQIGGGFHRYSVDEGWHIPHFEKMAVDNAALLSAYVEGAERFGRAAFEPTIRGTVAWLSGTLGDPHGGWGASQDADNAPGDDGGYYTWTRPQLHGILDTDEFRIFTRYFGVGSDGRMPEDPERSVLFQLQSIVEASEGTQTPPDIAAQRLERAIEKVRASRGERPAPNVDRALYANLNGALIRAYARAGCLLGDDRLLGEARASADRFLDRAYEPARGVAHRIEGSTGVGYGLLEDQAEFAFGLVELAGATAEPRYASRAAELLALIDREFRGEDGLFRDLAPAIYDGSPLIAHSAPSYPLEDSPHLAATAATLLALVRRSSLEHEEHSRELARSMLPAITRRIGDAGLFAAGSALAAGLLATPSVSVIIEGGGRDAAALERAARETYHPNRWVFRGTPPAPFAVPTTGGTERGARALVCVGTACLPPVTEASSLPSVIARAGRDAAA